LALEAEAVSAIAIELNDAEIRVARRDQVVAVEPGCAVFEGDALLLGGEAGRVARLRPELVNDRFWADLSRDLLPRTHARASSPADLAFAQLASMWSRFGAGADQVVFVVPGSFKREQLRLLLGMAEACAIPVGGLVASAVVCSQRPQPGRQLAHLDMGLHSAVLTALDQEGGCAVQAVDSTASAGLSAVRERCVAGIAAAFLSQTRFDPLHDADAEQALFDNLAACFERLRLRDSTLLEIEIRGVRYEAELKRSALTLAARPMYASLLELLRRSRPPATPLALQVSHRLASLPGLLDALGSEPEVEVILVEAEAACLGALARLEDICGRGSPLALVCRLSWESLPSEDTGNRSRERPTHLVHEGVAYALGSDPFSIGRAGTGLSVSSLGVEEHHCTLLIQDERVILQATGDAVTAVNGEPIQREREVQAGDCIRIGSPGVDLTLVQVPEDRGT